MKNLKIFTEDIEDVAREQIDNLLSQEAFKDSKIRIMPDVHAGAGCVIGFTGDLGDKVIPNIVGVDIGCGMRVCKLTNKLDFVLLEKVIREYVPYGFDCHKEIVKEFPKLQDLKCYKKLRNIERIKKSLGTLGGGNHFIEIDEDKLGVQHLVIHTGSRNLGKQVAEIYQDMADKSLNYREDEYKTKKREMIERYKQEGRPREIPLMLKELDEEFHQSQNKIPKELAYLEGKQREDYLHDMKICQEYAVLNRETIANTIINEYNKIVVGEKVYICDMFESVHNYISFKDNIIRKGAISAQKGELVIIPINMRDGCLLGIGKGNEDWNCSAPHGAGRLMGRMEARRTLDLEEYKKTMKNIFSTTVNINTIDEAPFAYKPIDEIIANVSDTIEIIDNLKSVFNFKDDSDGKH